MAPQIAEPCGIHLDVFSFSDVVGSYSLLRHNLHQVARYA
jgi:hypothetical protein